MKLRWLRLSIILTALAIPFMAGGGGSAATVARPKAGAKPAPVVPKASTSSWKTARPVIPEWAPKKPSPEFLRAARVLKPMPLESMRIAGHTEAGNAAQVRGAALMWAAAYDFFGTLSDAQIDRFLQTKQVVVPPEKRGDPPTRMEGSQVLIPIKQLTKKQRAALDKYLAAWREAHRGSATARFPEFGDKLLTLYKMGATRDLANVVVGFDTAECGAGHYVSLLFRVNKPDGTASAEGSGFAQL